MNEQRSYFSRALVILMAVMLIFTMMPSMAFAVDDPDASNATPATTTTCPVTVKAGETELTYTKVYANGYDNGMGAMDLYVVTLPANTDSVTVTKASTGTNEDIVVYNYDGTEYLAQATTNADKTVTASTRLASKYVQGDDGNYTQQIANEGTTGNYLSVQYPYTYDDQGNWTGGGGNICAIKLVLSSETLDEESVEKVKGTLYGQSANEELKFYTYNYYDYSMLGNNWYKGNTLKAEVGQTGSELIAAYSYLNAATSVPTNWDADDMSKITIKWYYGTTYSATGEGYQNVTINGASTGKDSAGVNVYKNKSGFEYSNEFVTPSTENQPAYYWFTLVPETVKAGSYYYYVDISYTDDSGTVQQISSKNCQAWVTVKEASKGSSSSSDITVNFSLNGFDGMASIAKKSVTVASGSTVGTVFEKVLSDAGYKYEYKGNNYIASITDKYNYTLGEFDRGSGSGWMYLVNDKAPTVGLKSYKLSDGDDIVWYYTGDYTKDKYARSSMSKTEETAVAEEEKKTEEVEATNVEKATTGAATASAKARSVKTKSGVKVTYKPNTDTQSYIDEMKALGYTVKYRFYRSTKKSSGYKAMLTKTSKTYTNLNGKADTRYYYKVQVRVYDKDGKLVAKTALKQCKYATRVF